ncbi:MAG: DUF547 domain-containing protein [Acidobacteriota bacterium]
MRRQSFELRPAARTPITRVMSLVFIGAGIAIALFTLAVLAQENRSPDGTENASTTASHDASQATDTSQATDSSAGRTLSFPELELADDEAVTAHFATRDEAATATVDHASWGALLDRLLRVADDDLNRFDYAAMNDDDRAALDTYLAALADTPVSTLGPDEQMAFWFNLYNALTVKVVIEHWPVDSIREIDPDGSGGPWKAPLVTVESLSLSLDQIENRILRPIWDDPRIHYGVNCASLSCPELLPAPLTASTLDEQLDAAARVYVNSPWGVDFGDDGSLTLSSIYDWYQVDFGGDLPGVGAHLEQWAEPELAKRLGAFSGTPGFDYDWKINAPL